jgi:pyruvoyl-dependent arginine decarboxylase (PvlArgDC)
MVYAGLGKIEMGKGPKYCTEAPKSSSRDYPAMKDEMTVKSNRYLVSTCVSCSIGKAVAYNKSQKHGRLIFSSFGTNRTANGWFFFYSEKNPESTNRPHGDRHVAQRFQTFMNTSRTYSPPGMKTIVIARWEACRRNDFSNVFSR